ncbi:MAG: hypothetical protein LBU87_01145, partial [Lactobacillales bacterium]|jgi:hypothetical protein|nr:hypothetical protein [Lactobacillales bacterium]
LANETIDELSKRSVHYATQMLATEYNSGDALAHGDFTAKTNLGYTVYAEATKNPGSGSDSYKNVSYFGIELDGVPYDVCLQILKDYPTPLKIDVFGHLFDEVNLDICLKDQPNNMYFYYSKYMDTEAVDDIEIRETE